MADAFQLLLAGLSGGVRGFAKTKRENELLVLEQKKERQNRQLDSQARLIGLLTTFYKDKDISPETLKLGLDSVSEIVRDNEPNDIGQLMGEIEFTPQEDRVGKPLTEFQRLTLEGRKQTLEATETDRKRKADVDAAKTTQAQELSKQKEVSDILKEEVDDIQSRISENNRLLKDQDTPVVDRETARRENIDFRRVLSAKNRQRKQLRDTLRPPITEKNIRSKIEVFRKMIRSGLTTAKIVIESFKERLGKQVERGELTVDEATEFTQRLRRRLDGS